MDELGEKLGTKEAVAMALEQLGYVRIVQVIDFDEERRKRK